jgi:hypothetical protein
VLDPPQGIAKLIATSAMKTASRWPIGTRITSGANADKLRTGLTSATFGTGDSMRA